MREKLQKAINLAVENHPGLANKAFGKSGDSWGIRKTITKQYYSSTEAILVGLLLELYHRCHGLEGIVFDWNNAEDKSPSEFIWSGSTRAADLFDLLDGPQQKVIQALQPSDVRLLGGLEMKNKILRWIGTGRVGASSKAMAMAAIDVFADAHHPHDPDDFNRCLLLLSAVPEVRHHMDKVAAMSKWWSALVARWDEVEQCFLDEVGLGWSKAGRAPKTYSLMQQVFAEVQ